MRFKRQIFCWWKIPLTDKVLAPVKCGGSSEGFTAPTCRQCRSDYHHNFDCGGDCFWRNEDDYPNRPDSWRCMHLGRKSNNIVWCDEAFPASISVWMIWLLFIWKLCQSPSIYPGLPCFLPPAQQQLCLDGAGKNYIYIVYIHCIYTYTFYIYLYIVYIYIVYHTINGWCRHKLYIQLMQWCLRETSNLPPLSCKPTRSLPPFSASQQILSSSQIYLFLCCKISRSYLDAILAAQLKP